MIIGLIILQDLAHYTNHLNALSLSLKAKLCPHEAWLPTSVAIKQPKAHVVPYEDIL